MHAGYFFSHQGIKSCGVDTSAAIGSTFTITFMVFDYSIPSLSTTATRTGIIVNPCDTGQYLCSDSTCSSVACDLRQVHLSFDTTARQQPGFQMHKLGSVRLPVATVCSQVFVFCICLVAAVAM